MNHAGCLAVSGLLYSAKKQGSIAPGTNTTSCIHLDSPSVSHGDDFLQVPVEENEAFLYNQSRETTLDSTEYLCLNGLLNVAHCCLEDPALASGNSKTSPNQQQRHIQEKSWHLPLPHNSSDGSKASASKPDGLDSTPVTRTRNTKGLSFDVDRIDDDRLRARLLRNRACAERSRLRRKAELKDAEVLRAKLEGECEVLQEENGELRRQLELLQVCRICAAVLCVWPRASALCDIHRFSHALCPEQRRRRASSRSSSRRGPAPRRGRRDGAPVQREQTEAGSDGVSHERDEPAGARKPSSKTSLKSRGRPQRDRAARPRGAISPDRAGARDGQRLRRCWRGAGETGEKEARVGREKLKGAGGKEWARGRKVGARCETCERGAKLARRECAPPHCAARS